MIRQISRLCLGLFVAAAWLPATIATSAVKNWTDGTGNWSIGGNWSGGTVPALEDAVNIAFTDGTARTVTYDVAAPMIGVLSIDLTGPGATSSTLSLPNNINLSTNGIAVGGYNGAAFTNGRGAILQSAGTVTTSPVVADLILGWTAGSTGTYTLSGGALVNNLNEYIGLAGTGTFNQSGGTNTINASAAGFFSVGHNVGSTGNYNLSGSGALATNASQNIGNSGTGVFNQTGGANTISGVGHHLYIGRNASGVGTYNLSGTAALSSAGDVIVGNNGSGTLTIQDQASVYVTNNLSIKSFSSVNLNGGKLRFNTVGGSAGLNNLNYTAGTIQLAGVRVFGTDSVIPVLFPSYTVPSGKGLTIEGDANIQTTVAINGGTLTTSSPIVRVGLADHGSLAVTNGGTVTANSNLFVGGIFDNYNGTITVSGVGSSLTSTSSTFLGHIGSGTLQITGGGTVTNEANATLGSFGINGSGTATVNGAGSVWNIGGDLSLIGGSSGPGVLNIQNHGLVHVGAALTINSLNSVNLNGGTIRFNGYHGIPGTGVNYTAGTVQLAGNRTLGGDAAFAAFFGDTVTIPIGKGLVVEGTATLAARTPVTLAGGTFSANKVLLTTGSRLVTSLPSTVLGPVLALAGSEIDATGGNLTLGDATKVNGFYGNGTIEVGPSTVTLADLNDAVLDSAALVTLGNGASIGTITAANGLTLDFGGNVIGFGAVNTPNNVAKPLINNGHITGNSVALPITLLGYVKGVGTFDNVNFTGTFSPGLSPTILTVGTVGLSPTSTLVMEVGGPSPGSGYDQILSSAALAFDGTLLVTLINGFSPGAGQSFNLFDWASMSGTFSAIQLPTLAGSLAWNTSQLYTTGVLSVVSPGVLGDYNNNGVVDAADYTVWRNNLGGSTSLPNDDTPGVGQDDYARWRTHFGQTAGSGSGANANTAVPEPATVILMILAAVGWSLRRCRAG